LIYAAHAARLSSFEPQILTITCAHSPSFWNALKTAEVPTPIRYSEASRATLSFDRTGGMSPNSVERRQTVDGDACECRRSVRDESTTSADRAIPGADLSVFIHGREKSATVLPIAKRSLN
jgi:hypothetical protein